MPGAVLASKETVTSRPSASAGGASATQGVPAKPVTRQNQE